MSSLSNIRAKEFKLTGHLFLSAQGIGVEPCPPKGDQPRIRDVDPLLWYGLNKEG